MIFMDKLKCIGIARKKTFVCVLASMMCLCLIACGSSTSTESSAPESQKQEELPIPDLTGEWKSSASDDGTYMGAVIKDTSMEIYWVIPSQDMTALYWAGSFKAPESASEPYVWTSSADIERNSSALLASTDETKDFTFQNEKFVCSVTAFEETKDVEFTKEEWGYNSELSENSESSNSETINGSGSLGKYDIEIKSATLAKDYEGNPAIVITYAWTNNSEDTISAMVALMDQAFQDGVELDTAIIGDSDIYDSDASMKDIRPGTTLEVQVAYVLSNTTSEVEFEISDWADFSSDSVVHMAFDPATL